MWALRNAAPETFALSGQIPAELGLGKRTAGLGGEALAALGATAADDGAAVGGSHTGTEAVGTLSADLAGLVSSFHDARSPY